jgi:DNA-directed RNA polymerase specialized sigma24 family protein
VRLHLLQHLQQGRTLSFAYAVRVAQGVLADFVQAQQRQPPAIPLKDADSHGGREPSLELRAAVRWALEQLPPDARALVWLHGVEGYTAEELTERFGCNAAACASGCTAPANGCANCWNEPSGDIYTNRAAKVHKNEYAR